MNIFEYLWQTLSQSGLCLLFIGGALQKFRKAHLGKQPGGRGAVRSLCGPEIGKIYLVTTKGEEEWKTFAFQELTCGYR